MNLFLVMGAGLCLATGFANADTTEVNSDNASEFTSAISFGAMEERVQLDSESAWYIVPKVGMNLPGDWTPLVVGLTGAIATFDSGIAFGLAIGVEMSNSFSLQFDIGYMKNDVDTIGINGVSVAPELFGVSAEVEQLPIMLRAIWTGSSSNMQPYVGFGLGSTRGELTLDFTFDEGAFSISDNEWAFTYQALAGIKFELSPSAELTVDYRFLHADYSIGDLNNHTIGMGVQFRF